MDLLQALTRVLTATAPHTPAAVTVTAGRGLPGPGHNPTVAECWRLVLVIDGAARFALAGGTVDLASGAALVLAPGTWVANATPADRAYRSLGMACAADHTRAYLLACAPGRTSRRFTTDHLTAPPLSAPVRRLLAGLEGANATRTLHIAALALDDLRAALANPPAADDDARWKGARHFIAEHCHRPLGRDEVARLLAVHPNHVPRLFRRWGGTTFAAELQRARLDRARALLADPAVPLTTVAAACGLSGPSHLIRLCRRRWGLTAAGLRDRLQMK